MTKKFNSEKLNEIINELLNSMDKSKIKVSKFHKVVFEKYSILELELEKINNQIILTDNEIKQTSIESKKYRKNLLEITKSMVNNPEMQQSIYEETYKKANELMCKMKNMEIEYKTLFINRDKLERELAKLKEILTDAEELIQSITTSFKYLNNDLSDISKYLNEKEVVLLKIIEAGENEKQKIVRDIHDGPAQTLAYLAIEIQLLKSLIKCENFKDVAEKVEKIDKYIQYLLEEIRQIIHDLRPMSLDDLGLIPTLETYIKGFQDNKGIAVTFKLIDENDLASKIPIAISVAVFRIIQEALNNTYKHSKAMTATINMELVNNNLKLELADDGKGFDVDETLKRVKINGNFGLLGMKERVDLINGKMNIISSKNNGTKLEISIPWDFQ